MRINSRSWSCYFLKAIACSDGRITFILTHLLLCTLLQVHSDNQLTQFFHKTYAVALPISNYLALFYYILQLADDKFPSHQCQLVPQFFPIPFDDFPILEFAHLID